MVKNGRQPAGPLGKAIRQAHSTGTRMTAASATRSSTTVSGGNSRIATPTKKNEPPHNTESSASSHQSLMSMRRSLEVMAARMQAIDHHYDERPQRDHPIPETTSRNRVRVRDGVR